MLYMGSKRRIADDILPVILKGRKPRQFFVEPFCGGCNVTERVEGDRVANDIHYELIEYYRALQSGWKPPKLINEDEYNRLRKDTKAPARLRGYAGFTHSFGGTFFGTYRRNPEEDMVKGSTVIKSNYKNMEDVGRRAYETAMKQQQLLKDVLFYCGNYYEFPVPPKSIIYCDPPYAGTSKYKVDAFPHKNFFAWCTRMAEEGHTVYISEYSAPEGFKCIWEKEMPNLLSSDSTKRSKKPVEKIFVPV